MKLVIDISEEEYNECKNRYNMIFQEGYLCYNLDTALVMYIANGTPIEQTNTAECDRNICLRNEYNGISCDECEVNKTNTAEFRISNAVSQIESAEKLKAELTAVIQRYVDKHEKTNTAECFTIEELESWLWQNVLNNSDNAYGESVETLIGRLDGFKRFVEDSRMKGENQ